MPDPNASGKRLQEVVTYSTMTRSLLGMADRLRQLGVTRVVMEATGDYWKPVFYILEAAGFETWLVNAKDVKHLPGRPKTDLLTELPARLSRRSVRQLAAMARFRPRDQRRGHAAGVVPVGSAAARLAGGDGGFVRAVSPR
ncbi:MAG: IS110 family transposase [Mycobacterium sp.]